MQCLQHARGVLGQTLGRHAGIDVGAQVEVAELERRQAAVGALGQPVRQFVRHCTRNGDDAVGRQRDGIDEIAVVFFRAKREAVRPQQRQQVIYDKPERHAAPAQCQQLRLVLGGDVGGQVEAEEQVAGAHFDGRVFRLRRFHAQHLVGEAARVAVAAVAAVAVHRLDAVAGRRRFDQNLQDAAHHPLDAGLGVVLDQGGDVDQQLARQAARLVGGDGGSHYRQLGLVRLAVQSAQRLQQLGVVGLRTAARELFNGGMILAAHFGRRVVVAHVVAAGARERGAARRLAVQLG